VLGWIVTERTASHPMTPLAAELASKHLLYGEGHGGALELVTSEPAKMGTWFHGRLGFPVHLPSVAGDRSGWSAGASRPSRTLLRPTRSRPERQSLSRSSRDGVPFAPGRVDRALCGRRRDVFRVATRCRAGLVGGKQPTGSTRGVRR